MKKVLATTLIVLLGASSAMAAPVSTAKVDAAKVDADVREVIARYHLPGIAVGVIENGNVVFAKGYGETVAGSGEPVTPESVFKIASNSKAMTATLLARLVQQGKLHWDDPVVKYLPDFAMHDPWVTAHMTVSDLLVHNSGLSVGAGDLMFWPEPNLFTRQDILHALRYFKPAYEFRSGYAYDNLLYVIAGMLAEAAGGAPYETLIRREVFAPLGLAGCKIGEFKRSDVSSLAQPHRLENETPVAYNLDKDIVAEVASAPAGGVRCDLNSMLIWANQWLSPSQAQLKWLDNTQRHELWKARTTMPISARKKQWDNTHYYAYAYGFRLADVDGQWTVSHTGTLGGMYSMLLLLPDQKSGFVFMVNGAADTARDVLGEVLLKHFTAPEKSLGVKGYADALAKPKAQQDTNNVLPNLDKRKPVSAASLSEWLGVWRDPWFGDVRICEVGNGVEWRSLKSPRMHGTVNQLEGRYMVMWGDAVDEEPWLFFSKNGSVRELKMARINAKGDWSSDYQDFAFTRVSGCE